jgi:hypothetical protein
MQRGICPSGQLGSGRAARNDSRRRRVGNPSTLGDLATVRQQARILGHRQLRRGALRRWLRSSRADWRWARRADAPGEQVA